MPSLIHMEAGRYCLTFCKLFLTHKRNMSPGLMMSIFLRERCLYISSPRSASSYSLRSAPSSSTLDRYHEAHGGFSSWAALIFVGGRGGETFFLFWTPLFMLSSTARNPWTGKRPVQISWPKLSSILNTKQDCR